MMGSTTVDQVQVSTCLVDSCPKTNIKARGLCRGHYEAWRQSPESQRIRPVAFPEDSELLRLFQEERSFAGVCRRLGLVANGPLRKHLAKNPELNESCRACLPRLLTDIEKRQRAKASSRKWRSNNPEAVKRNKRKWAGSRDPEVVRKWNRHNATRRAASLSVLEMTPEDIALSYEYETILLSDPCSYFCGSQSDSVDHIEPIFVGGDDRWSNKTGACRRCNSSKRDKGLLDYLLWSIETESAPA